jgi:AAA+ superfamily predicted ATPase
MNKSETSLDEFGTEIFQTRDRGERNQVSPRPMSDPPDDEEIRTIRPTQWILSGPDTWQAVPPTYERLIPGLYIANVTDRGIMFHRKSVQVDDLISFPGSFYASILDEIHNFWEMWAKFKKYGFLHRRGYLFYGPAGSGKSSVVQQIVAGIIHRQGLVFMCQHPKILEQGLAEFRRVEPERPIVCLFEDIDAIVRDTGEEGLLSLLDGETQIDRVLNIATTNYPEQLDKRIVARPRRFDRIIKVGMPTPEIRHSYFSKKLKIEENELEVWVKATEEFSFAACAELVISVKCLGNDFDETVKKLRDMLLTKVSSRDFDSGSIGFAQR